VVFAREIPVDTHGGALAGAYGLHYRGGTGGRVTAGEDPLDARGAGGPVDLEPAVAQFHGQVADQRLCVKGLTDRGDDVVARHREVGIAARHRAAPAALVVIT